MENGHIVFYNQQIMIKFYIIRQKGDNYMHWSEELKNNITDIGELAEYLGLNSAETEDIRKLCADYPMSVTRYYLSLVNRDDPLDPIRRMCIPTGAERSMDGDYDTSGEADNTVTPGLQHKYRETALLLTTNRCAMYCRHCFRKRLVGASDDEILSHFGEAADYIRAHTEITNVLLSGGDALMLPDDTLERYISELSGIDHLDLVRIASRMPVTSPQRIYADSRLLDMLGWYSAKKQLYVVTQFNHPRELTEEAHRAIHALLARGVVVKNQTVLLRGVNDSPETLGELLKKLTAAGATPYYVFQCRPVTGVKADFQVPISEGYDIVERAKARQNGQGKCFKYCMSHPTGKIEIAGKLDDGRIAFKYHQTKDEVDEGRIFIKKLPEGAGWLDEI